MRTYVCVRLCLGRSRDSLHGLPCGSCERRRKSPPGTGLWSRCFLSHHSVLSVSPPLKEAGFVILNFVTPRRPRFRRSRTQNPLVLQDPSALLSPAIPV